MRRSWWFIVSLLLFALLAGTASAQRSSVKVLRVRVSPVRLANGDRRQIVQVDWKNIGRRPITKVTANIIPYGSASRQPLKSMVFDYTIFSSGVTNAVRPGMVYREPKRDGYLLSPTFGRARRVSVTIVGVKTL